MLMSIAILGELVQAQGPNVMLKTEHYYCYDLPAQKTKQGFHVFLFFERPSGSAAACSDIRIPFFVYLALPTTPEISVYIHQGEKFIESGLCQSQFRIEIVSFICQDFKIAGATAPVTHFG